MRGLRLCCCVCVLHWFCVVRAVLMVVACLSKCTLSERHIRTFLVCGVCLPFCKRFFCVVFHFYDAASLLREAQGLCLEGVQQFQQPKPLTPPRSKMMDTCTVLYAQKWNDTAKKTNKNKIRQPPTRVQHGRKWFGEYVNEIHPLQLGLRICNSYHYRFNMLFKTPISVIFRNIKRRFCRSARGGTCIINRARARAIIKRKVFLMCEI